MTWERAVELVAKPSVSLRKGVNMKNEIPVCTSGTCLAPNRTCLQECDTCEFHVTSDKEE